MESRADELHRFKRFDLVQYAVSRGYEVDQRSSSRQSVVVKHSNGDKLIIGKDSDGTYFYFNAKGSDNGTIIDFVQMLDGGSIGHARKTLRAYSPLSTVYSIGGVSAKAKTKTFDRQFVSERWRKATPVSGPNGYLTDCRCIPASIYLNPMFRDRFRVDKRGNVVAAHFDNEGLCGFEMKNGNRTQTTFTGFCPSGVKGLFASRTRTSDRSVIFAENFVDLLSVATLRGTDGFRFFSTAGRPSPRQLELIVQAIKNMPSGANVELCFDNDDGGNDIANLIEEKLEELEFSATRAFPPNRGTDWNDVLRDFNGPSPRLP